MPSPSTSNAFEQARRDTQAEAFGGRRERYPTDLLPPKARAALRNAAASWRLGRTTRAMEKWAVIVGIATEKPDSLGFVPVAVGGTKALAELLDTSPGNVSRSLKSWEQQGAIFRFEHKGIRGLPSLVGIQVPELTDALVWFASRAFSTLEGSGAGGAPMTIPQAQKIAGNLLERRTLLPHSLRTFSQASVVLDLLSSGAANEELQAHLSRLG